MKYLILPMIFLLTACASTSKEPQSVELAGRVLSSYVSTPSGMLKGNILLVSDPRSIGKIEAVGNGNSTKLFLEHADASVLSEFAGKQVTVIGELELNRLEAFRTDFILNVTKIVEQP
ncbi:hypothetical protein CWE08_02590 [Aliidiomarina iranensis]|uniref:Lipoprotein n=1 Tax=Aliidiomarina iranensis TaxID=1434071 RepID=A0A432W314_9GAMM|nr:hypothetical protein [Aliidiomarina iranensis]RUO23553.1 hypothetical protein CWE08_02590 [Aliidiomarina iranensis]